MRIGARIDRAGRGRRLHALNAPDGDHGVDALFHIAQGIDHLAGALPRQVLEGTGGEDVGDFILNIADQIGIGAQAFQTARNLHQPLSGLKNIDGRPLCGGDDGIQFIGGDIEAIVGLILRTQGRDFPASMFDGGRHFQQLIAQHLGPARGLQKAGLAFKQQAQIAQGGVDLRLARLARAAGMFAQKGKSLRRLCDSVVKSGIVRF